MAYMNNRAGKQTRATFQVAGGCIVKFRHPYLAGAIDSGFGGIDEIDVSASLKLSDTFFNAVPNQRSAYQQVLIDGSVVTITNHLSNGTITLPVIPTTGLVATGDFIAALQLVKSCKDGVGGTLTLSEFVGGRVITTFFYGVAVAFVPDKIKMGLDVPTYNVELLYAGWLQAASTSVEENMRKIWAVGSSNGVSGYFKPYEVNAEASTGSDPVSATNLLGQGDITDDTSLEGNANTSEEVAAATDSTYAYASGSEIGPTGGGGEGGEGGQGG